MNFRYKISIGLVIMFLFLINNADAASPLGRYGWMTPISQIIGDDNSCGPGLVKIDLELLEFGTSNQVIIQSAVFLSYNKVTQEIVDSASGSGPIIGPICFNPDTEGTSFDIIGGGYYDVWSSNVWQNSAVIPKGKHMRQTVWLVKSPSQVAQYRQVSPVNIITRTNPEYKFSLNSLPNTYGASAIYDAQFYLVEYNSLTNSLGEIKNKRTISLSGGTGIKTIPPVVGLADGMYTWAAYLALNGTNDISLDPNVTAGLESSINTGAAYLAVAPSESNTLSILNVLKSGFMWFDWPFTLDTTAPVIDISSGHVPLSPISSDTVTLTGEATDNLSGITQMKVFVNGVDSKTCDFAAVNSALCDLVVGPYAASTTIEYFFTAKDMAGNVATSSTMSFVVVNPVEPDPVPVGTPISCSAPSSVLLSNADAVGSTGNATPQALAVEGNYIYAGASGDDDNYGLYIYDATDPMNVTQLSFFSTHNPPAVQNLSWGADVLGLDVEGGYAYLASYYGGLVIVDVSNPNSPLFVGKVPIPNETWEVVVRGDYAYLAAGTGMVVVDVSDKSNPTIFANYDLGAGVSQDITLSGDYAYVVMRDHGFAIFKISEQGNPSQPVIVSQFNDAYNGSQWAYGVAINGNYLYVANHFAGEIRTYDVTDRSNPIFITSTQVPGTLKIRQLYLEDDVLYISGDRQGAYIYDVSNPINPTLVYRVDDPVLSSSIKAWGVVPLTDSGFTRIAVVSEETESGLSLVETTCDPLSPTVSPLTATVNPIVAGASTTLSWTVSGDAAWCWLEGSGGGWQDIVNGSKSLVVSPSATETYTIQCGKEAGDSNLESLLVTVNSLPSVTFYPVLGCTIPTGSSTCNGTFTWNFTNGTPPYSVQNLKNQIIYGTNVTGGNVSGLLDYGPNTILAKDSGILSESEIGNAECNIATDHWDSTSSTCVSNPPTPSVSVTSNPNIIRSGAIAPISIEINSTEALSCTILNAQNTPILFNHDPLSGQIQTYGPFNTRELTSAQIVTVICSVNSFPAVIGTDEVRINIIGIMHEV